MLVITRRWPHQPPPRQSSSSCRCCCLSFNILLVIQHNKLLCLPTGWSQRLLRSFQRRISRPLQRRERPKSFWCCYQRRKSSTTFPAIFVSISLLLARAKRYPTLRRSLGHVEYCGWPIEECLLCLIRLSSRSTISLGLTRLKQLHHTSSPSVSWDDELKVVAAALLSYAPRLSVLQQMELELSLIHIWRCRRRG